MSREQKIVILLTGFIFLVSLFFPAFGIMETEGENVVWSITAFLTGWLGTLVLDVACISWWANIFLFTSWFFTLRNQPTLAFKLSILALALCCLFLFAEGIIANEGGGKNDISSIKAGYYIWLGSVAVNAVGMYWLKVVWHERITKSFQNTGGSTSARQTKSI